MSTFYEILGINQDASPLQIKKGYFSMIRKYPPERFPEKFMEIREAYETLSNEDTRKEYDSILSMPGNVRAYFEQTKKLVEEGDYINAIKLLEDINKNYPNILIVQSLLGEVYLKNKNNVKAARIFENLTAVAPNNAAFAGHLANAYLQRGWQKKAINAYKRAIELDKNNISLWTGLSEAYFKNGDLRETRKTLNAALKIENEDNGIFLNVYFKLVLLDIQESNMSLLRLHLGKLTNIALSEEDIRENVGWILIYISKQLITNNMLEEAMELINKAEQLIPNNISVKSLKNKVNSFMDIANEYFAFEDDNRFSDELKEYISSKLLPYMEGIVEPKHTEILNTIAEYGLLNDIDTFKGEITLLKELYPKLYNRLKNFFDDALNSRKRKSMLKKLEKKLSKNQELINHLFNSMFNDEDESAIDEFDDDYDDDDDMYFNYEPQEPYIRETPKIGRNDPCPCGSGKKYKKCCGK